MSDVVRAPQLHQRHPLTRSATWWHGVWKIVHPCVLGRGAGEHPAAQAHPDHDVESRRRRFVNGHEVLPVGGQ